MTTVQKVGAVLRKAGFERSRRLRSGEIKGWGHSTEGYQGEGLQDIRPDGPSRSSTSRVPGREEPRRSGPAEVADKLASYRGALVAVGLTVGRDRLRWGPTICSSPNPEEAK